MEFTKDEIERYLPKYLTPETEQQLFDSLRDFPSNLDERLYSTVISQDYTHIYQGDGLRNLLLINLPNTACSPGPGLILSNTCDINPENERIYPTTACYAPIFKLAALETLWKDSGIDPAKVASTIDSIRKQRITSIFFLPKGSGLEEDSVVFLDRIISSPTTSLPKELKEFRLFSLSQYGHYLLVVKLSIHFSRINEKVDRDQVKQ